MTYEKLNLVLNDPTTIAAIISSIAAIVALVVSYWSFRISKRALKLAERQDRSRQPSLSVYLKDSILKFPEPKQKDRVYAMLISISNTSDSDNSVSQIELYVTLLKTSDPRFTIKLPIESDLAKYLPSGGSKLEVPLRIDAHQTVVGWCYFALSPDIIKDKTIHGYKLILTDAHENTSSVETSVFPPWCERNEILENDSYVPR